MDQLYRSIISGERAGALPAIARVLLEMASWPYALVILARNALYDRGILKATKLPVPVICVGNITTGGTGKTPTVIMLVQELQRMGKRPAVLTRGYGAPKGGRADEVMVIEQECPGVPVVVNGDRIAGGKEAISKYGADVLVMDDGFQHRRLARDLNIVLIDATEPMGIRGMLPRGSWREPPQNLARADMIILTRCEQVTPELADLAGGLLTQWVVPRNIYQQRTQVLGLFDAGGQEVSAAGQRVIAFAGVGSPNGFLYAVRSLGLIVSAACWFDDHHQYEVAEDFERISQLSRVRGIDAWVTTLKDWVKLRNTVLPMPVYHLRIAATIPGHSMDIWRDAIAKVVSQMPAVETKS
jgi:tetraacyldisaccharide 4'-kinase